MNTFSKLGLWSLGAVAAFSVVGCNKEAERGPNSATAPAATHLDGMTPAARSRSAAEQIAQARCEREQQCGNIGGDKTYSSSQDCLARIQTEWKDDLNARECPGGINQQQLNECMAQVRGEACGNPFDTLARVAECTSGQICIEQP
jgi:hypothetical protein